MMIYEKDKVYNIITVEGDLKEVNKFFNSINSRERVIDFNRIKPIPSDELEVEHSLYLACLDFPYYVAKENDNIKTFFDNIAQKLDQKCKKEKAHKLNVFLQNISNYLKYGFTSKYEWSCENWGTYENASESCHLNENTILFKTELVNAYSLLKSVFVKFPKLKFTYEFTHADNEGCSGRMIYCNGNATYQQFFGNCELQKKLFRIFIYNEVSDYYMA